MTYELKTSTIMNQTYQPFPTPDKPPLTPFAISLIILSVIICICGIMGNLTVALVILKSKKMQTPTNWFVFNLAVCDIAIGTLTIPYNTIDPFIDWPFGRVGCKYLIMPVMEHFASVCVLTHASICFARYTVICKVGDARIISKKLTRIVVVIIWLVSFIVLSATLMGPLGQFEIQRDINGKLICMLEWVSEVKRKVYRICVFILTYIIPLIATGYSYYRMHHIAVTSLRKVSKFLSSKSLLSRRKKTRQMDSTLITMYLMFTFTTLPFQLFIFLNDFHFITPDTRTKIIFDLLLITFYMQIVTNPLVLLFRSYEYPKEINRLCPCCSLFVPSPRGNNDLKHRFKAIRRRQCHRGDDLSI